MRQYPSSAGSAGLPTRLSVTGTLLTSLVTSLAVVAVALALLYPVVTAAFLAGGVTATLGSLVVRRMREVRKRNPRGLTVRVPFTNRSIEL